MRFAAIFGAVIAVFALIFGGIALFTGYGTTDGGHVAVIRNGGPLDNHRIRQVVPAGSGRTRIGFDSSQHNYPTSSRFFTISKSGNSDNSQPVNVQTADGINVGLEGTAYFTVNTKSDNNYATLKKFDNEFGTRKFNCAAKKSGQKDVWEGDDGFNCFLDQVVYPIIKNNLRDQVGDISCSDLVASCSLVQNSSLQIDPSKIGKGNVNLRKIEAALASNLQSDLDSTLGGNFIDVSAFNLQGVDLPDTVQNAINTAQSNFANVSTAQADLAKAKIEAQANEQRQLGYNKCTVCGEIDLLKALPPNITTFAPGNGFSLSIPVK